MQFNAIFKTLHCNQNFLTSLIKKKTKQKTLNISSSTILKKKWKSELKKEDQG